MPTQQMVLIQHDELRNMLREELTQLLPQPSNHSPDENELLTRTNVAHLFKVSLVTVHHWMNTGILPYHRIGGRTFFKRGEVINAMNKVRIRRRL